MYCSQEKYRYACVWTSKGEDEQYKYLSQTYVVSYQFKICVIRMEEEVLVDFLESPLFVRASSNATRLVAKLKQAIQHRELYETHQILRTIYFRFVNSKDKVTVLEDLLYQGACYLLKLNENVSGQDIATLFLEAAAKCLQYYRDEGGEEAMQDLSNDSVSYHANKQSLDWDISQKLSQIAVSLPKTDIGQSKFIADALRILNPKLLNRSLLHNFMANKFWQHEDYAESRYHFLHCSNLENAQDIANLLVDYQTGSATRSEVDLFITQFIFQFLCLQSPIDSPLNKKSHANPPNPQSAPVIKRTRKSIKTIADKIFSQYTLKHPTLHQVSIPFSRLPLLNFTFFIISIIDTSNEAATFNILRDIYKLAWSRDPDYQGYLNRIGTLYFGVVDKDKQRQGGGFFNNILMSLLEGTGEDDEDSNQDGNSLSFSDELD